MGKMFSHLSLSSYKSLAQQRYSEVTSQSLAILLIA